MNKKGFTLAELLITLGIIGLVAAITAPILTGIMPDKDKVQVLKYYKMISDITTDLLNNPGIYWVPAGNYCKGLGCAQQPLVPPYNEGYFSYYCKYSRLLAANMELVEDVPESTGNTITFKTIDGTDWYAWENALGGTDNFSAYLEMDLNGKDQGVNCYYTSRCRKPDTFRFHIDTYGKITGADPLTRAYLNNRYKLNDKRKDYRTAAADKDCE